VGGRGANQAPADVKKFMRVVLNFSFYCVFVPDVFVNFGAEPLVLTSKCVLQHKGENNEKANIERRALKAVRFFQQFIRKKATKTFQTN
jgi:hypothetical protein